jgi:hypothetical protein
LLRAMIIGGLAVAALAWTVLGFRWLAAKSGRVALVAPSVPESAPEIAFVGGVRSRTVNATAGLARLEFFDWGIQVQSSLRVLRWMIPTWQAHYEELVKAQLITVPGANNGVRFQLRDGGESIIFWTFQGAQVLNQLEAHGVPVDREVTRLRWAGGLDQRL